MLQYLVFFLSFLSQLNSDSKFCLPYSCRKLTYVKLVNTFWVTWSMFYRSMVKGKANNLDRLDRICSPPLALFSIEFSPSHSNCCGLSLFHSDSESSKTADIYQKFSHSTWEHPGPAARHRATTWASYTVPASFPMTTFLLPAVRAFQFLWTCFVCLFVSQLFNIIRRRVSPI